MTATLYAECVCGCSAESMGRDASSRGSIAAFKAEHAGHTRPGQHLEERPSSLTCPIHGADCEVWNS